MQNTTLTQYAEEIKNTLAKYVRDKPEDQRYLELILGLAEECAEVTSIIRKSIKGNYHEQNIDFEHLKEEIGDVLWYITQIIDQLPNMNLERVARKKLKKPHTIHQKFTKPRNEPLSFEQYTLSVAKKLPKSKEERARFLALGLIAKEGEISKMFGEHIIDSKKLNIHKVKKKLGDLLWYLAAIAQNYGLDLGEIAKANSDKTHGRYNKQGEVINAREGDMEK